MQGLGFGTTVRSITWMSPSEGSQPWLDNLGEWAWPGLAPAAAAEALPPAWVPTRPPAPAAQHPETALPAPWLRARRLLIAVLLIAVAGVSLALALEGKLGFGGHDAVAPARSVASVPPGLLPVPALRRISTDSAGSEIAHVLYPSASLRRQGSFYVYLPPSMRAAGARSGEGAGAKYPVLYLLHGNSQHATAFLEAGLQEQLDALIRTHAIPPMIAVMIQGGGGANNWRNLNGQYYESYVLEVQEIVDRMLPTIADRSGRAIAGVSMGGFGAMQLALDNPDSLRRRRELARLLQRPRRPAGDRPAHDQDARPQRVRLRRPAGQDRRPERGRAVRSRAASCGRRRAQRALSRRTQHGNGAGSPPGDAQIRGARADQGRVERGGRPWRELTAAAARS